MPIIQITLIAGRPDADVQDCIREVARAAARTLKAPLSTVRVMVTETPPSRYAIGDVLKSDPPAATPGA